MQGELLAATGLAASAGTLALVGAGVIAALVAGFAGLKLGAALLTFLRLPVAARMTRLFCRQIAPKGIRRLPHEGLRSYVARVLEAAPHDAQTRRDLMASADWLCAANYGPLPDPDARPAPSFLMRMAGMSKLLRLFVSAKNKVN